MPVMRTEDVETLLHAMERELDEELRAEDRAHAEIVQCHDDTLDRLHRRVRDLMAEAA